MWTHCQDIAGLSAIEVDAKKHSIEYSSEKHSEIDLHPESDGIHDGLEFPTEEERETLRRVPDSIPWAAYLIAIVEFAERFSTNFIQRSLPPGSHTGAAGLNGQAGALGMGQRASTGLTTFYQFWCYVTPLLGAYIADAHWGRYKTICWAVVIALVIGGHGAIGAFCVALVVMGFGTGMFKANISPLVAEQYKRTKLFVITTKSGERVIVDPSLTTLRVYMYFYELINIGALIGQIGMTYSEKFVGFWLAYTLPTVWSLNPVTTYRNLTAEGFWEDAKPSKFVGTRPAWMNFDDQWVDEVKRGLKACAVFLWYPIYWLTYNQLNNNLTSQAATMSLHGIPNDVLSNLDPFALIILIPSIYPGLRRMGLNFTALKKITLGFFTGSAAMIWAAVLQHYIYKTNPCGEQASLCADVSPLNVWIQSGSYILIAISEILASITGLEYAFTKAPKNMRSLVMSVFLFMSALSSALGEAFVSLSADPLLVWNYGVMAVLAGVSGILFWWSVRDLDAKEDELNNLAEGHVEA
ncbi:peptide transporter PTR2A [Pholiota molesta]|nr:peptide transporter PTR2A [Pholiota molesta]